MLIFMDNTYNKHKDYSSFLLFFFLFFPFISSHQDIFSFSFYPSLSISLFLSRNEILPILPCFDAIYLITGRGLHSSSSSSSSSSSQQETRSPLKEAMLTYIKVIIFFSFSSFFALHSSFFLIFFPSLYSFSFLLLFSPLLPSLLFSPPLSSLLFPSPSLLFPAGPRS